MMESMDVHLPHDEGSRWSPPPSLIRSPPRSSAKSGNNLLPEESPPNTYPLIPARNERGQNFCTPVIMINLQCALVFKKKAAVRLLDKRLLQDSHTKDSSGPIELQAWEHKAQIQADGKIFYLIIPNIPDGAESSKHLSKDIQLPPRLAKIAQLVISGCTDKQIAVHTGLSFSTVRTYVRQIYRRVSVHSRVELVHAANMGLTIHKEKT